MVGAFEQVLQLPQFQGAALGVATGASDAFDDRWREQAALVGAGQGGAADRQHPVDVVVGEAFFVEVGVQAVDRFMAAGFAGGDVAEVLIQYRLEIFTSAADTCLPWAS